MNESAKTGTSFASGRSKLIFAGELRKNGLKIKLQEQPFQVLAMLLGHPGEVVTREESVTGSGPPCRPATRRPSPKH